MLAKTQRHGEFLIAQFRMVGRQFDGKPPLIVAGSPADSAFEQPFSDAIPGTTTHLDDFMQQRRHMDGVPEPSGQRRIIHFLSYFHTATITWRALIRQHGVLSRHGNSVFVRNILSRVASFIGQNVRYRSTCTSRLKTS